MSLLGSGNYLWSYYREPLQPGLEAPLGPLRLVTPPSGQVITLTRAKKYARIELDFTDDDDEVNDLIAAATEFCQKQIMGWRQFLVATYSVQLSSWWAAPLRLPLPPLKAVDSIKYIDTAGVQQTLDPAYYEVQAYQRAPGEIDRTPAQSWPSQAWPITQRTRRWPVTIQFQAGYPFGQIPKTIQQAIAMCVADWYTRRVPCGPLSEPINQAVLGLLGCDEWGSYSGRP